MLLELPFVLVSQLLNTLFCFFQSLFSLPFGFQGFSSSEIIFLSRFQLFSIKAILHFIIFVLSPAFLLGFFLRISISLLTLFISLGMSSTLSTRVLSIKIMVVLNSWSIHSNIICLIRYTLSLVNLYILPFSWCCNFSLMGEQVVQNKRNWY